VGRASLSTPAADPAWQPDLAVLRPHPQGSDQFVEGYQAFANYITPDGKINSWSLQAQRAIAKDPAGLCRTRVLRVAMTLSSDMKELAVQAYDGGPYVKRTARDRS